MIIIVPAFILSGFVASFSSSWSFDTPIVIVIFLIIILFVLFLYNLIYIDSNFNYLSIFNMFLLVIFTFYVAKPLFIIFYLHYDIADFSATLSQKGDLLSKALSFVIVAVIFAFIGYRSSLGAWIANSLPILPKKWDRRRLIIVLWLCLFSGLISYIILMHSAEPTGPRSQLVEDENKYAFLGILSLRICLILLFTGSIVLNNKLLKRSFWIYLPVYTILMLKLGGRGRLVYPVLMCLIIYNYLKKRIEIKQIIFYIICFLGVVSILFDLAYHFLFQQITSAQNIEASKNFLLDFMLKRNLDRVDNFILVIKGMKDQLDFQYGKTFLSIPFKFLPADWPKAFGLKLIGGGTLFMQTFFPSVLAQGSGIPITLIGELFLNFHIVGIGYGMFILGVFIRIFQDYMDRDRTNPCAVILYSLFFVYLPNLIGGNISHFMLFTAIDIFLLFPAMIYITRHSYVNIPIRRQLNA